MHSGAFSTCAVRGYEDSTAGARAHITVTGEHITGLRVAVGGEPPDEAVWTPCTFAE